MVIDNELHRKLGAALNKEVWELLGKSSRRIDEDWHMIHAAHASHYHWLYAGTIVHEQRGEWLIARVYTTLGHADSALRHAERCAELTAAHASEMKDFDLAYAQEGLARATALKGDREKAAELKARARQLGNQIADAEDRKIFDGDFAAGEWYGVA